MHEVGWKLAQRAHFRRNAGVRHAAGRLIVELMLPSLGERRPIGTKVGYDGRGESNDTKKTNTAMHLHSVAGERNCAGGHERACGGFDSGVPGGRRKVAGATEMPSVRWYVAVRHKRSRETGQGDPRKC